MLPVEKTSSRKFIVRRKKTIILPGYMIAEYIECRKSGHQCSETFINVFVFFTHHLLYRINVFAHFCVTLPKVWVRLPWFAAMAMLGRTIPWKIAGVTIIAIIFQLISKFPYFSFSSVPFPFLALCRKSFISLIPTVRQTNAECYGTEKWWY